MLRLIISLLAFLPHLSFLTGQVRPVNYMVLLQNNLEMRANGGFAGSYAVITIDNSEVGGRQVSGEDSKNIAVRFQDIYVPAGQITGHIEPPLPIQEAFLQGTWLLPNFDWEPDFATASAAMRWFFEKGGEVNPDFLITLNLTTIKNLLEVVGDLSIPEYNLTLTPNNVYSFLQNQAEVNFFPGSTQKKDALTAVGSALFNKLKHLSVPQYADIAKVLFSELNRQNIVVNSNDQKIQKLLEDKKWAGRLTVPTTLDSYLLVETNLGANKANCCVERVTKHFVTLSKSSETSGEGGSIHREISLTFTNNSPLESPDPPRFYGGNYRAYLRFYLPKAASDINVENQDASISARYNMTEVGLWSTTKAGTSSTINLSYNLPNNAPYRLTILKQNGMISSPQELTIFGKKFSTPLESQTTF